MQLKIGLVISNKSIELVIAGRSKKLEFPVDVIKNQEILNDKKYVGMVTNFFNENNLVDEKIVFFLSKEILYEKKVSFTNTEEEEKEILKFLNTIPFENSKINLIKIPEKEMETIIAVNTELYNYLLDVCRDMKLIVEIVVPLEALGDLGKDAIIWKVIPSLIEKIDTNSPYNFLLEAHEVEQGNNTKKYLIILLILLLLVGTIFLMRKILTR